MDHKTKALVIIPAYNEEGSLEHTVGELEQHCPDIDYLIVNDGSMDHTKTVCWRNGYNYLDLVTNLGLAGAFQAGVKYAYEHDYDCVIQFDADGQHDAGCIYPLIDAAGSHDIVIGSRFLEGRHGASLRDFGSRLISGAIRITTGKTITDPTSGLRAFGKRTIRAFAYLLNFAPEPDTIAYLVRKQRLDVIEIPVVMNDRFAGESYLSVKNSVSYMLRMTLSILFIQFFRRRESIG